MKKNHHLFSDLVFIFLLLLYLLFATPLAVQAVERAISIPEIVEKEFPGAHIQEIRNDTWQGVPVKEVEIETADGVQYELSITESGEIVEIEEEEELPWIGGSLSAGIAIRGEKEIYRGVGSEFSPTPFFRYENGPFEILAYDSLEATLRIYRLNNVYLALHGNIDFDPGYNEDDSDYLRGMKELDTLYGGGLQIGMDYRGLDLSLQFTQDISGEHDGQELEFALAYPFEFAGFSLRPELSIGWLSENVVDYLYGVSAEESRPDRPMYSPGSSYELEAELLIRRPLWGNFSVIGLVGISSFGSDVTDSPLVDRDYELEGAIGVAYSF